MLRGWVCGWMDTGVKVSIPAGPERSRGRAGGEQGGGGVGGAVAAAAVQGRSRVELKEQFLIPQP